MQKVNNWENIQGVESSNSLPAGAYVCKILKVEDFNTQDKQYLRIEFDIYEGDYKGYYLRLFQNKRKWYGTYFRSYDERSLKYFKGFITAVQESNNGYVWNFDEQTLVNKLVVFVFGYEEYLDDNGNIKQSLKPRFVHSIKALKEGKIKLPEVKRLVREIPKPTSSIYQNYQDTPQQPKKEEPKVVIDIKDEDLPF